MQYGYASGAANTIRRTSIIYPNGRQLNYAYNAGDDDARAESARWATVRSRRWWPTAISASAHSCADYQQPGVRWDSIGGTCGGGSSSGSPSTSFSWPSYSVPPQPAESYSGLDQFGRVVNNLWCKYTMPSGAVDQIQYGYDLASNRTFRRNVVAATGFDELYAYDGVHRLTDFNRGTLNQPAENNISPLALKQEWRLDATGNWSRFQQFNQSDPTQALDQQRTSDTANEITEIGATVGPVWATPPTTATET